MAGIVSPCVSVSGYRTVRYSFRVSRLLRARGLPGLLFLITAVWLVRFGRSAMRRRVDVDLRNGRLLNRRGNCHGAFTLAPQLARVRDSAIRNASDCATEERRADDGGPLNVRTFKCRRARFLRYA